MKFTPTVPPRAFQVGGRQSIVLRDCGRVELEPNEQVTFVTESGAEYDIARKSWGFYATPSLNGRLQGFGLRAVLVKSQTDKFYVLLVERAREGEFTRYLEAEGMRIVSWLDNEAALGSLERKLHNSEART